MPAHGREPESPPVIGTWKRWRQGHIHQQLDALVLQSNFSVRKRSLRKLKTRDVI